MAEIERCTMCRGTKRILGLGMMDRQCPNCKGIGWVSVEAVEPIVEPCVEPVVKRKYTKKINHAGEGL